jgi:hypothetical protein
MTDAFDLFHQVPKPEIVRPSASIFVFLAGVRTSITHFSPFYFTSGAHPKGGGGGAYLGTAPNPNYKGQIF